MANDTPTEKAEAASIRRRWITLGEVLAVAAVAISGLTFWNSYSERSHAEAERSSESRKAQVKAATLLLKAEPSRDGERLSLSALSPEQTIQAQTISFPTALGVAPAETTGEPRIEGDWFEDGLKKARRAAQRKDETAGDERLPVAIRSQFLADGALHDDVAIYDVGYVLEGRLIGGSALKLRGISLVGRAGATSAQARLDAIWKKRQPTISSAEKK
ncbi:MAG: hypothetical protein JWM75_2881 [Sphingomonas bacterium]|nr:hypothetical protein [Sphingomonas bacterium]